MNDCSKYTKRMLVGIIFFILIFINPLWRYSELFASIVSVIIMILSLVYILPYFRCYGSILRQNYKK